MDVLKISKLKVAIDNKVILNDFSLTIKSGETHAIMGPNGAGKSTIARVIMGDPSYEVLAGHIYLNDIDITHYGVDQRAQLGIFLGMQLPLEIEGVTDADFMRTALHSRDGDQFKLYPFIKKIETVTTQLHMDKDMIHRSINKGFSGGERKKNEIMQMYMLEPKIIILDEIDSGLDVDSLRIIGENVTKYIKAKQPATILITHYERLLDYIKPTNVHIMKEGTIVESGGASLAKKIEKEGYEQIKPKVIMNDCLVRKVTSHE